MNIRSLCVVLAAGSLALTGCGGSGSGRSAASRGAIKMTIHWPEHNSRLIPIASQSIGIEVDSGGQKVASQVVPRPPQGTNVSNVEFDNLAPGNVVVGAGAFPTTNGTGVAQAAGAINVTVVAGQTITTADLVMNSTVVSIQVQSNVTSLNVGQQATLTATPLDGSNPPNAVLVAPSQLTFASDDAGAYTIQQNGAQATVTGNLTGTHGITVTYVEPPQHVSGHISFNIGSAPPPGANVVVMDQTNFRYVSLSDAAPGASYQANVLGTSQNVFLEDMATDSQGNVFMAQGPGSVSSSGKVVEYDTTGHIAGSFTPKGTLQSGVQYGLVPYQICVDPQGRIYFQVQLVDEVHGGVINTIYRVDSITGFPATLKQVTMPTQFAQGLASDGQFLYLCDFTHIYRINADLTGAWSAPFGSGGSGADQFAIGGHGPGGNHALALDPAGTHLFIADFNNSRIARIDTAGFNGQFFNWTAVNLPLTSSGTAATTFKPISVAVDSTNQHVVFTGLEDVDPTQPDNFGPTQTNVVNTYVERIDVSSFASVTAVNRMAFGGPVTYSAASNQFGRPASVGAK